MSKTNPVIPADDDGPAEEAAPAEIAADPADEIGARLASARLSRGIKVTALARQVGVSPSLISQIERSQSRPSVSTLFALAEALDVPVDAFFRDSRPEAPQAATAPVPEPQPPAVAPAREPVAREGRYMVRREHRAVIDIEGGIRWERLTTTALDHAEFLELVYGPHAESHATLYRHPGMEMVLVLSGRLVICIGFDRYELEIGDSMCFPSSMPHRYLNPTAEPTRAVTVILPDGELPEPMNIRRRP